MFGIFGDKTKKKAELTAAAIQAISISSTVSLMEQSELLSEVASSFGTKGGQRFDERWDVCFCAAITPLAMAAAKQKYKLSDQKFNKFFEQVIFLLNDRLPEYLMAANNLVEYANTQTAIGPSDDEARALVHSNWMVWNIMEKQVENDDEKELVRLIASFLLASSRAI